MKKPIKVRLRENVIKSEFLMATFGNQNFEINIFDFNVIKTTILNGEIGENGALLINIPKYDGGYIRYGYDEGMASIWECEDAE